MVVWGRPLRGWAFAPGDGVVTKKHEGVENMLKPYRKARKLAVAQTERSFLYNAYFPRLTVSTAPADVPHLKRPAPPLRPSRRTIIPEWG